MFRKCLKYDLASVWRIWWILAASAFGAGVLGCFALRGLIELAASESDDAAAVLGSIILGLFVFAVAFALIAFVIATEILTYIRYYKHFFSDEGYLTFTLPVPRKTLFFSKLINAFVWTSASVIVLLAVIAVGLLVVPPSQGLIEGGMFAGAELVEESTSFINPAVYVGIGELISAAWEEFGAWCILFAVEALAFLALMLLLTVSIVQMCITIGAAITKRLKVLAAVGIYYAFAGVMGFVASLAEIFVSVAVASGESVFANLSEGSLPGLAALLIGVVIAAVVTANAAVNFCALGVLERKLNLS